MISFKNDYNTLAAPRIIEAIVKYQDERNIGYGEDYHTANAKKLMQDLCKKNVDSYILAGGTQTNVVGLCQMLKMPYEAVISVESGHINVHETGALEGQGRKSVMTKGLDGKVLPQEVKEIYNLHNSHHMVIPKAVYISNSTEIGTIYTKAELKALREVCDELGLYLFMDGARLASALTAVGNDLTLKDIAHLTDMFYLGGTKCGLPLGEMLVITNEELKGNMKFLIKNKCALLAKGFLGGIIFEEVLKDDYFLELALHENKMADLIRASVPSRVYYNNPTNQVFLRLSNDEIHYLHKKYLFEEWESLDDNEKVMRFVTSYSTRVEDVESLIADFNKILK